MAGDGGPKARGVGCPRKRASTAQTLQNILAQAWRTNTPATTATAIATIKFQRVNSQQALLQRPPFPSPYVPPLCRLAALLSSKCEVLHTKIDELTFETGIDLSKGSLWSLTRP